MRSQADRRFVVVSGVPGSGKTSLAKRLASVLELPLIDKDDILERLFESKGTGDSDWRHRLSRDSNDMFRREAESSDGAVLVSFWHFPGMAQDSGTPTGWLLGLSNRIVHVHCECPPEIAAARFTDRERHPGHLDHARSLEETLAAFRDLARLQAPQIGPRLTVDTSRQPNWDTIADQIRDAWESRHSANTP